MEKSKQRWPIAVWTGIALIAVINYTLLALSYDVFPDTAAFGEEVVWRGVALVFGVVGALIISRDRKHIIGWLLMVTPIMITVSTILAFFIEPRLATAETLDTGLFLYLWFNSWSWWLLIGPIILIFYLFPTGHLASKNWRWGVILLGIAFGVFMFLATFSGTAEEVEGTRTFPNPIGFLSNAAVESLVGIMGLFLVAGAVISLISLFIRYRGAQATERAQMRWLFIACALFVINYSLGFVWGDYFESGALSFLFMATVLFIPVSIGIAILRYRLWDVDVVINRSLVYGTLSTIMAALFAGLAAILAQVAKLAFGEEMQSGAAAVAAIVVASFFTPIRTGVENFINKRMFPENIDLTQGLIEIDPDLWNWVDLPTLLNATLLHLQEIYSFKDAAVYRKSDKQFLPVQSLGVPLRELSALNFNKKEMDLLTGKKGVVEDGNATFAVAVPIYLARRNSTEVLGVLRLGKRAKGRGYTGNDAQTLSGFGAKLGKAFFALSSDTKSKRWID